MGETISETIDGAGGLYIWLWLWFMAVVYVY
jgi:hypothetical protein